MSTSVKSKAQQLHWELEALAALGVRNAHTRRKHREAARLYQEAARQLLAAGDPAGWIDLFAAISHSALSGDEDGCAELIAWGRTQADNISEGKENVRNELLQLEQWARTLNVVPSLAAFARDLPSVPRLAA